MSGLQLLMHHVHAIQIHALFLLQPRPQKTFGSETNGTEEVTDVKMQRNMFHFTEQWKLFTCISFTPFLRTYKFTRQWKSTLIFANDLGCLELPCCSRFSFTLKPNCLYIVLENVDKLIMFAIVK